MALTDQEEAGVRRLLAAVAKSGASDDDVTDTLRIGVVTTQMARLDDRITVRQQQAADDAKAAAADVAALRDDQARLAAARRALPGGGA